MKVLNLFLFFLILASAIPTYSANVCEKEETQEEEEENEELAA